MPQPRDVVAKVATGMHRTIFRLSGGRVFGRTAGMTVLELETAGRRSGKRRTTMLTAPIHDHDRVVLVASYGGADHHPVWFLNLRDDPDVKITMSGSTRAMTARVATADEREELWPQVTAAFRGYAEYQEEDQPRDPPRDPDRLNYLASRPVPPPCERSPMSDQPLAGIRVFELGIAIAAPSCGLTLAHHGAEVLKVESPKNLDVTRLFGSAWAMGVEEFQAVFTDTSPYISEMHAGKKSVALDLKHPDGLAAAKRIVAHCDVFVTNYSTPAVKALGLSYKDVKAARDDIIYVALPGFSSDPTSPYYEFISWGPNQAPLVGLDELTGFPDQEPAGIATVAAPDYFAGLHATFAVLTGLAQRDATGEGAFVDISQLETTVSLLGPFLADCLRSGRLPERQGNRLEWSAPEGVYPSAGTDCWVAISVGDDEQFAALAELLRRREWRDDARLRSVADRREHQDELDEAIAAWTSTQSAETAAGALQAVGIAAYAVLDVEAAALDPQIRDRRWFDVQPSSRFGREIFAGHAIRTVDPPAGVEHGGPMLGEDTVQILEDVAGFSAEEIEALLESAAAFGPTQPDLKLERPYDKFLPMLTPRLRLEKQVSQ